MRCLHKGCPNETFGDSNYCRDHKRRIIASYKKAAKKTAKKCVKKAAKKK